MKQEYTILYDILETLLAITASQKGGQISNWVFVTELHLSSVKGKLKVNNVTV